MLLVHRTTWLFIIGTFVSAEILFNISLCNELGVKVWTDTSGFSVLKASVASIPPSLDVVYKPETANSHGHVVSCL